MLIKKIVYLHLHEYGVEYFPSFYNVQLRAQWIHLKRALTERQGNQELDPRNMQMGAIPLARAPATNRVDDGVLSDFICDDSAPHVDDFDDFPHCPAFCKSGFYSVYHTKT